MPLKQIKRWLAYQYMKDQDIDPRDSGAQNPYRILLHKLVGTTIQKPRRQPPVNIWRKTQRKEIDIEAKKITDNGSIPRSKHAAVRDKVARDMYEKLPEEEKAQWIEQATEEYATAMERWQEDTEANPSTASEDRQKWVPVYFSSCIVSNLCTQMHPGVGSFHPTHSRSYLRRDWLELLPYRRRARTSAWWAVEYYQVRFDLHFLFELSTDTL